MDITIVLLFTIVWNAHYVCILTELYPTIHSTTDVLKTALWKKTLDISIGFSQMIDMFVRIAPDIVLWSFGPESTLIKQILLKWVGKFSSNYYSLNIF